MESLTTTEVMLLSLESYPSYIWGASGYFLGFELKEKKTTTISSGVVVRSWNK
jgi:hypothetical protein